MERQGAAEEQVTHVGTDKGLRGLVLRLPRGTERCHERAGSRRGKSCKDGHSARLHPLTWEQSGGVVTQVTPDLSWLVGVWGFLCYALHV